MTMKNCNNCGHQIENSQKFCRKCGSHLITNFKKAITDEILTKTRYWYHEIPHWLIPWIILSGLFILAIIIFLPTKIIPEEIEVQYKTTEEYSVEEPFIDIEEYEEEISEPISANIPVTRNEQIRYLKEWEKCASTFLIVGESTIKITNIDSEGGTFVVRIGYLDKSGQFVWDRQSKYIPQSSSATFTYSPTPTYSEMESCQYVIEETPSKVITEYKSIIESQTKIVTRERPVKKTQIVTKERDVMKTRKEIHYKEVNWLFGFDAVIKFRSRR